MENKTTSSKTRVQEHTITIEGINSTNNDLIMSDGGFTIAEKSSTIFWIVDPRSGVEEITEIKKKTIPTGDIFKEKPAKESANKSKAKIKYFFIEVTVQYYYKKYTKTPGGQEFTYDPKIQVNS